MRYLLALLLAVAAGAAAAQQMYRWTDKDGKVHYGPTPPPGVAAKAVKGTASQVAPQTPAASPSSSGGQRDGDDKPRRIDPKKQY
jgi:hypothetical protein